MRKKLCLLVMCMAVSFVIVGCGNSSSDKSDTKTSEEGKTKKLPINLRKRISM